MGLDLDFLEEFWIGDIYIYIFPFPIECTYNT